MRSSLVPNERYLVQTVPTRAVYGSAETDSHCLPHDLGAFGAWLEGSLLDVTGNVPSIGVERLMAKLFFDCRGNLP